MDGQAGYAPQNSGDRTSHVATDRSSSDVGWSARRARSLGSCNRHREHCCVLRHCAQNGIGNLVITTLHLNIVDITNKS